jgi:hypothetical protein
MSIPDGVQPRGRLSRRGFLNRVGATAGAVVASGGIAGAFSGPTHAVHAASQFVSTDPQHFGRLFPNVEAFASPSTEVTQALVALGAPGGPLDAHDQLSAGPVKLISDPTLSLSNPDNPTHTAGTTFMGQFIDHDITFDTSSPLGTPTDPLTLPNGRTPSLDLDSVYGGGPVASPALYDPNDPTKLLIGSGGIFEDLTRLPDGTAIIGDPRNDEHRMIAGLYCAFILFHNRAVDYAGAQAARGWQEWLHTAEDLASCRAPESIAELAQTRRPCHRS